MLHLPLLNRLENEVGSLLDDLKFFLRRHSALRRVKPSDLMSIEEAGWLTDSSLPSVVEEASLVLGVLEKLRTRSITKFPTRWLYDPATKTLLASLTHRDGVKQLLDIARESGELHVAGIDTVGKTTLSIRLS